MERKVVKRRGHTEPFEEKKLYASVYSASLNCHYGEEASEDIASSVLQYVKNWLDNREEVKSKELRKQVIKALEEFDEDLAMMYDSIMDIC